MRTIIFANGWLDQPPALDADDWIIAADGGARHCIRWNIRPAVVIGDMDSLSDDELSMLKAGQAQIIQYPRKKDYTDLELALQHALAHGADEIWIIAALGARWDQTLANLLLPAAFAPAHIRLIDGQQEIGFVRGGEQVQIQGRPGDTVSLIPLSRKAQGIRTQSLEYSLNDEDISLGSTRGISNVLLSESGRISLREGILAYVIIHEKGT